MRRSRSSGRAKLLCCRGLSLLPRCQQCQRRPSGTRPRNRNRRIGWTMAKKYFLFLCLISFPFCSTGAGAGQNDESRIHVDVVLVQLNVAVTDGKGNYISGLGPENFSIVEDNIPERTATFEEGNEPPRILTEVTSLTGHTMPPGAAKAVHA